MHRQPDEHQPAPDKGSPLSERVWHFIKTPLHNDPWTPEDTAAAHHPAASKLCLRCLQPNPPAPQSWFCPNCGAPTGDCNTAMPFLQIFSVGELARRSVMGKPKKGRQGFFEILSLVLFSFAQYSLFAPVYWIRTILKAIGHPLCDNNAPPPNLDLPDEDPPPQPPQPTTPQQRAAAQALSRAFTICALAIAALLTGFVIAAVNARNPPPEKKPNAWILQPDGTIRLEGNQTPVIINH